MSKLGWTDRGDGRTNRKNKEAYTLREDDMDIEFTLFFIRELTTTKKKVYLPISGIKLYNY